jgi:regulatory protein
MWEGDPATSGAQPEPPDGRRKGEPRALPWSLDDMRRTGNRSAGDDDTAPRTGRRTPSEKPAPRDPREWAREICLRQLSVRPRTRAELAAALTKRAIPDDIIAEVLDRYDEVGIIDDAAFARAWVESRHHGKGLARRALGQELRRKGVEQDLIKGALAELEPETEEVTARELVERKLRTTRGEPEAVFRKLVGMLARKGYPPGVAVRAVKDVLELKALDQDFSVTGERDLIDALEAEALQAELDRPDRV